MDDDIDYRWIDVDDRIGAKTYWFSPDNRPVQYLRGVLINTRGDAVKYLVILRTTRQTGGLSGENEYRYMKFGLLSSQQDYHYNSTGNALRLLWFIAVPR